MARTSKPSRPATVTATTSKPDIPKSNEPRPLPDYITKLSKFGVGVGKWFIGLGVLGLMVVVIVNSCSGPRTESAKPAANANYCAPAPEAFRDGTSELRFRESEGVPCYDIVLSDKPTPWIFPPLENQSGDKLINLITPGEIFVQVLNGRPTPYSWSETKESLKRRSVMSWNFNEKCMIFSIRGHGTARVIVDQYEQMTPGGVKSSTHCPGMY